MFTFAAVWLSAPLLHIFVENLFGQVRRSAPKHSHLHVNEERADKSPETVLQSVRIFLLAL